MDNVILYSTGCPKCNVLKKKLDAAGISYTEVSDISVMEELGIDAVPVLKINNEMLSYMDAVKYIHRRCNNEI